MLSAYFQAFLNVFMMAAVGVLCSLVATHYHEKQNLQHWYFCALCFAVVLHLGLTLYVHCQQRYGVGDDSRLAEAEADKSEAMSELNNLRSANDMLLRTFGALDLQHAG